MTDSQRQDPLHFYLDKSDPSAWKAVGALSTAAKASAQAAGLSDQLIELVFLRVSQINGCSYCLNVHSKRATRAGVNAQRQALLAAWEETDVYTDQEKAALYLAETVTELPAKDERDFAQLFTHGALTDEQYGAVQWLAIVMNVTNRISIMSNHPVKHD
ncbi:carboxymuconolactone decarboxylase family protein [Rothia aerolata]|uniref:Alkyl hydroperoxide reductase AhpD n=1 Tax=Rothia aerolata TaxID=1812262 RepID=A0A917IXF5_9MICC|nr:carboxymuconolactone decarboxylase family protein [Rothia aerolata]GGH66963.1 alkyl hydroperoxide reductase AhpD [Rothia aerolata]